MYFDQNVLITGAARGIGRELAIAMHRLGAHVTLLGLEPDKLAETARYCDGAPYVVCDVSNEVAVRDALEVLADTLDDGVFDIVICNAGIAKQTPILGGSIDDERKTFDVNYFGTLHVVREVNPYLAHEGYILLTSSLAAGVQLPLMNAYSASKAAVAALGNTLRAELRSERIGVGVAYYAELDTDMTHRGFGTEAAEGLMSEVSLTKVAPLGPAIKRILRGVDKRSHKIVAPWWVRYLLWCPPLAQRVVEWKFRKADIAHAVTTAASEDVKFTTPQ